LRTDFSTGEAARLVVFPTEDGGRLAWRVLVDGEEDLAYESTIDAASGAVLQRQSITEFAGMGLVHDHFPGAAKGGTAQAKSLTPDATWLDDSAGNTRLAGNNVHAYPDEDNDNLPDREIGESTPGGGDWLYPLSTDFPGAGPCPPAGCTWNSDVPATREVNRASATVSLFYLSNKFHDHLLKPPISFDEASGNFERVNASGSGAGGDAVLAESNDGRRLNNASFGTPSDGFPGRMQVHLFTYRDTNAAHDPAIIYHEYTHGLSNRLVTSPGGNSGLISFQARGMGEGWSDFYAVDFLESEGYMTDTDADAELKMGEYVYMDGGIRSKPMDCPVGTLHTSCDEGYTWLKKGGYTFGDLYSLLSGGAGDNVHAVGELWSQTLWDLRRLVGSQDALALVTGGMRLSPDDPDMLQMRDAILQQALVMGRGLHRAVWKVFAGRGMGHSASTPGSWSGESKEAFDLPPVTPMHKSTQISDPFPTGDNDGIVESGEVVEIRETLTNVHANPLTNVSGTLTSSADDFQVQAGTAVWPTIAADADAVSEAPFKVAIAPDADCGPSSALSLGVSSDQGNVAIPVPVTVGRPRVTQSADVPKDIPNYEYVGSELTLPAGEPLTDLDVTIGRIRHSFVGDLIVKLTHDEDGNGPKAPVTVTLVDQPGYPRWQYGTMGSDFIETVFDDEAALPVEDERPPFTGRYKPVDPLSAFDGMDPGGVWRLSVSDQMAGYSGSLLSWGLTQPNHCDVTIPSATTQPTTRFDHASALVGGTVDAGGAPTEWRVAYGPTADYGSVTSAQPAGSARGARAVSTALTGLEPLTTYHYRVEVLRDGAVANVGEDRTFTTPDVPPPAAPALTDVDPDSPANENLPRVKGTAPGAATVALYTTPDCEGSAAARGSADELASSGISVPVVDGSTTTFRATASDAEGRTSACSTSTLTYAEDSTAPGAPALSATEPLSPANHNAPRVEGTAEAGSTVKVYAGDCTGAPLAQAPAAALASGVPLALPDDSTTRLRGTATDSAGNVSPCSAALSYVEDSTAPAAPAIQTSDPVSPANSNSPRLKGTAEPGSIVRLFAAADCAGSAAVEGSAAAFGGSGLSVSVPDDSTTSFRATATDAARNTSACSSPFD
ncbi:MAG: M36 family metallopeptidase, partial [Actinomycetota bacterium]|nr:M36 family metallopeptidase [Actinomycetota bacterium]